MNNTDYQDPYNASTLYTKLHQALVNHQPPRIAFFDIDSTITGTRPDIAREVRAHFDQRGYAVAFVTSRTEECMISEREFHLSKALQRPLPHLRKNDEGKQVYIDPKNSTILAGTIDPDVICGTTGTNIYLHQNTGGYMPDLQFLHLMKADPLSWRKAINTLLDAVYKKYPTFHKIPIEDEENYYKGLTDVYPPDHRIQLEFDSLDAKNGFEKVAREVMHEIKHTLPLSEYEIMTDLRVTDDSFPAKPRYSVYITPHAGYKAKAVHQVVTQIIERLKIPIGELEILIGGDSFPDISMGMYGGLGAKATFLLVGGSRMTSYLINQIPEYVGEDVSNIEKHLSPTGKKGVYHFHIDKFQDRTIVLLDEAYPGKIGPESILEYFKNEVSNKQ